jgi:hypothetical protein
MGTSLAILIQLAVAAACYKRLDYPNQQRAYVVAMGGHSLPDVPGPERFQKY